MSFHVCLCEQWGTREVLQDSGRIRKMESENPSCCFRVAYRYDGGEMSTPNHKMIRPTNPD